MKKRNYLLAIPLLFISTLAFSQDTIVHNNLSYDPEKLKLIPDKVFEFGIPMLFIVLLMNAIITILKNKADHQLKLKMLDKGISEETIKEVFKQSSAISVLQPLKYLLITASLGGSFIVIHFLKNFLVNQSGYFALGIILISTSIALFIYYRVLKSKL